MPSVAEIELDLLILSEPERCRRLLDGYFLLLGDRRLWWQRYDPQKTEPERWARCVRRAITLLAQRSAAPPRWVAGFLDEHASSDLRSLTIEIALEYFEAAA